MEELDLNMPSLAFSDGEPLIDRRSQMRSLEFATEQALKLAHPAEG